LVSKITVDKLLISRSVYKVVLEKPEEVYVPLGLTRATFYRYTKILDNYTNEHVGLPFFKQ